MLLFGIYPRYDGASSEAYLAGWALSAAVEMALKAVTSRPGEPVMLRQPIPVDQLPTPPSC